MRARVLAEFFGTAFLLMIVAGSGIMGETLSQGNVAIALLANSLATGFGLFVLIQALGPVSGAHLNPLVTLLEAFSGKFSVKECISYLCAQFTGALSGIIVTHAMFNQPLFQSSLKHRNEPHLFLSEFIATFGLLAVIKLSSKTNTAAPSVASYIAAAYWFTSSTSFANPAVTVARMFTDTFCGIAPAGAPGFILAQAGAWAVAFFAFRRA